MNQKLLLLAMFVFIFIFFNAPASLSQSQTFNFVMTNDNWDSHMVYEVDLIITSTDVSPIQLASFGIGLTINNSALNGGTLTATWVPGSSELTNSAQIPTSLLTNTTSGTGTNTLKSIRIVGKAPPGTGNGSMLSNVAPGTKIGRLRLTNSVDFVITGSNHIDTAAQTVYPKAITVYIGGLNINITTSGTFIKNLTSLLFSNNSTGVLETKESLPNNFELGQNYPNPFNPSTVIRYTLPSDSKITLDVYNITGTRIAQLVDQNQSAGFYSVDFNSSTLNKNISSGVYFYRLNANNKTDGTNFISIKKMVILK
jgi:hypothetical protein